MVPRLPAVRAVVALEQRQSGFCFVGSRFGAAVGFRRCVNHWPTAREVLSVTTICGDGVRLAVDFFMLRCHLIEAMDCPFVKGGEFMPIVCP